MIKILLHAAQSFVKKQQSNKGSLLFECPTSASIACLTPTLRLIGIADKAELKDAYACPVYTTEARFREEVFTAQLKSKATWVKWALASVAAFLDVV